MIPLTIPQRWAGWWARVGARGNPWGPYEDLLRRYAEPGRYYHTLDHIASCLFELDDARREAEDPDAVEFALWLHDVVHDTKANDNEEQSARFALKMAGDAHLPDSFGRRVANLIMASRHAEVPRRYDAKLLVDIDLSILGKPDKLFDRYEREIRQEYAWVPNNVFAAKRAEVLRSFLERRTIYATPFFQKKYEGQARENLNRSIAKLAA